MFAAGKHGLLEFQLLELCAAVKARTKASPVLVRMEFPEEGGVAFSCRTLPLFARIAWWLGKAVALWK